MASPFLHKFHNHKSAVIGGVSRVFEQGAAMRGLIILIFSMPIQVFAWNLFGPDNYDDCVLE